MHDEATTILVSVVVGIIVGQTMWFALKALSPAADKSAKVITSDDRAFFQKVEKEGFVFTFAIFLGAGLIVGFDASVEKLLLFLIIALATFGFFAWVIARVFLHGEEKAKQYRAYFSETYGVSDKVFDVLSIGTAVLVVVLATANQLSPIGC